MTFHISYPAELPVSERREDLMAAIAANQVTIIAGETGSGKTTQIPKMCLELGLGENGLIGHTQPRRLAARTVAERIAEELGVEIGQEVGFQVRFTGEVSRSTKVKLMTDGILLAEIQRDKLLRKYNAIIIDEAHERSLNIDFILGYLKRILPQRPDLKVIITSATIDPERFAKHFGSEEEPSPIIEVSGRTYPVEIRYRPLSQPAGGSTAGDDDPDASDDALEEDRDPLDAVCDAVDELALEAPGDILIFFSGEREIRDAAEALNARIQSNRRLAGTEVLPLFARLSLQEQHKVFHPGSKRRIVLATNVAETSLTVPGIKYVIDTGHGADLTLLTPHQGPAPADRTGLPGFGQPAFGPLRPRFRRHRHPAVLRRGLRVPAAVHRPGDPAHQPCRRHPADDRHGRRPRPQGRRELPVRGTAGLPRHQRRRLPAPRARCPDGSAAAGTDE
ncbi:HrpA-like RNA helicase [Arthrobacter sp. B3I4]|nr:HrpA-like RNA helicase [Arthrobacter sp. B3I4]